MNTRTTILWSAVAIAVALSPVTALAQRGTSGGTDEPAADASEAVIPEAPAAVPAAPAPRPMWQTPRERPSMPPAASMPRERHQTRAQNQAGRNCAMQQDGEALTERERLERMQEHMVQGMRRMATRMWAVQERLDALDRGETPTTPLPEMGRMQGGQMQGGQMQGARHGTGPSCPAAPATPPAPSSGEAGG